MVVYVGLGLEGRLGEVLKKQDTRKHAVVCFAEAVGIKTQGGVGDAHDDDDHDSKAEHEHHEHGAGYVDPHLWLDPVLVEKLVHPMEEAVVRVMWAQWDPECVGVGNEEMDKEGKRIHAAADSLGEQVKAVDKEWTDRLAPLKGKSVVTHHNAFGRPSGGMGSRSRR